MNRVISLVTAATIGAVVHYRYNWTVGPKGGEPVPDTGQGLFVFERQPDGSWLIAYDLWSSDGAAN